jgi:hypothetical protein
MIQSQVSSTHGRAEENLRLAPSVPVAQGHLGRRGRDTEYEQFTHHSAMPKLCEHMFSPDLAPLYPMSSPCLLEIDPINLISPFYTIGVRKQCESQ